MWICWFLKVWFCKFVGNLECGIGVCCNWLCLVESEDGFFVGIDYFYVECDVGIFIMFVVDGNFDGYLC